MFPGGKWKLKRLLFLFVAITVFSALGNTSGAAQNDNQSKDARAAVNKFFLLLKSRAEKKRSGWNGSSSPRCQKATGPRLRSSIWVRSIRRRSKRIR